ncbi:sugar phosphate isomerase/epimerase family protein [Halorussus marinus]|uniref:sugar phosphate isomerase/epimerase family protein n=1 Tax=Halorussus marinus TaxID=2505976 RepID=UPI00106EFD63|nr:sugar phosphate isomerase/epimerase [Halorussus marinus]
MRSAIQLYTLRELDEPVPALVSRVGETAFDGVEFAGLGGADPRDVRRALDDAGLDAAAAHVGIEALENDFEATVETYRRLECDRLVVPYLDEPHFTSRDRTTETARLLAEIDARLGERGLGLAYHNHDHEFVAVGDATAYDLLVDETDLDLELDAGWATAAGREPAELLGRLRDRAPLVHLKDVAGDRPVELGDGDLDAERCVRAAREAGTEWLVYEHDDPDDPEASLARGAAGVADLLA